MELDASMLQPIAGRALDALAVPVEWSVVPILAGNGQGLVSFVSRARRASAVSRVGGLCVGPDSAHLAALVINAVQRAGHPSPTVQ
jgi:hypothetical protein